MTRWIIAACRTALAVILAAVGHALPAAGPGVGNIAASRAEIEFFETKIRPILATSCQKCHGAKQQKGGLRLDSREALLRGGESGAVVVAGKPQESPLIDAVNYRGLEMPPTGRLKPREITALTEWVQRGVPWSTERAPVAATRREFAVTDEDRRYWSFQPLGNPQPPKVHGSSWAANPIDAYILAQLRNKGLKPNPPAEPRALIRRVFFDLIGLPPTPEEVDAFVADHSPAAYERLIDGLLARPQYGERWGRHWLDVARFAQTNGYERDGEKLEAWRYRDYVIQAFNDDKPYDRFILEQLAGDELPDRTNESILATGLYRLGTWDDEPDDRQAAAWDEIDELIRTTGSAFLGLTIGCARCHNHMFDPISQEDYYGLAAFFRNVEPYGTPISPTTFRANDDAIYTALASGDEVASWKVRHAELTRQIDQTRDKIQNLRKSVAARLGKPAVGKVEFDERLTRSERQQKRRLEQRLARLEKSANAVPFPRALSVHECGPPLKETHILVRGNAAVPGKKVEPRLPMVFGGRQPHTVPVSFAMPQAAASSARASSISKAAPRTLGLRRELARWIAARDNPLTPRVMMDRLWQFYFGRGIVRSSDNFGRAGTPPTHPELLAWLARDFIDGGWRLKRMHRRILLSNTYQMSSTASNPLGSATDADNDLFWRQNLRRLDAEAIRDTILAVSGNLNLEMRGRGIFPKLSPEVLATQSRPGVGWGQSPPAEECRRSVYVYVKRTLMVPFFEAFDYTNTAESVGIRSVTTVAPQSLLLLNSAFTFEQAAALAARVRRESDANPARQIDRLFRLALGRSPTPKEREIASDLFNRPIAKDSAAGREPDSAFDRLRSLCLVVLNLNEFVYED